jgi:hypothetical protein
MNISPRKKLSVVIEAGMAVVAGSALLLFVFMALEIGFNVRGGDGIAAVTPRDGSKVAIRLPGLPQPPEEPTNEQAIGRRTGAEVAGLPTASSISRTGPTQAASSTADQEERGESPAKPSSDQPASNEPIEVAVSGPVVSPPEESPPPADSGTDTGAAPSQEPEPGEDHNPSTDDGRSEPPKDHPAPEGPDPGAPEDEADSQEPPPPPEDEDEDASDEAPEAPEEPTGAERPNHPAPSGPEDEGDDDGDGQNGGNDEP